MKAVKLIFLFLFFLIRVEAQTIGFHFGYSPAIGNYWGTYGAFYGGGLFYNHPIKNSFSITGSINYNEFTLYPKNGAVHFYKIANVPLQATFNLYGNNLTKWQAKFLIGYSAARILNMHELAPQIDSNAIVPSVYNGKFPLKFTTQFGFELQRTLSNKFSFTFGAEYRHYRLPADNLNMPLLSIYTKVGFDLRKVKTIKKEKQIDSARYNYKHYQQVAWPPDMEL